MARYDHPAIKVAQGIYDESRDLLPHEEKLLRELRIATGARNETVRLAIEMFGEGSPAAIASADLSDRREAEWFTQALAKYQAEHERIDQGEDRYDEALEAIEAALNAAEPFVKLVQAAE